MSEIRVNERETPNKYDFYDFLPSNIGTNEKLSNTSSLIAPPGNLVTRIICCTSPSPTGSTIMPPGFNWSINFGGISGAAAVINILSNGA